MHSNNCNDRISTLTSVVVNSVEGTLRSCFRSVLSAVIFRYKIIIDVELWPRP